MNRFFLSGVIIVFCIGFPSCKQKNSIVLTEEQITKANAALKSLKERDSVIAKNWRLWIDNYKSFVIANEKRRQDITEWQEKEISSYDISISHERERTTMHQDAQQWLLSAIAFDQKSKGIAKALSDTKERQAFLKAFDEASKMFDK